MLEQDLMLQDRIQAWLGTGMLAGASILSLLIFADRMSMDFVTLPAVWYSTRSMHLMICGMMFLAAAVLLKSPGQVRRVPSPVFESCRLLTRTNCGLCDEALTTLMAFQEYLPVIQLVDIEQDPVLVRQFGESIPVVEIDGRVRFRGGVSELLLQRMIDAAMLRERNQHVSSLTVSEKALPLDEHSERIC
ncbi:MAG: glutaredoxin family protein [Planctomycetota bacterium]